MVNKGATTTSALVGIQACRPMRMKDHKNCLYYSNRMKHKVSGQISEQHINANEMNSWILVNKSYKKTMFHRICCQECAYRMSSTSAQTG